MKNFTAALAGNPNSGKTTLFNALTGSNLYVGNWPGVTVERREARFTLEEIEVTLTDLPGVYSLFPYSIEERVAADFLREGAPDLILNIVDATNPERNLYLTMQLIELGRPMVIVLNLIDELRARGGQIDHEALADALGVPVIPISAKKREGFDAMFSAVYDQLKRPIKPSVRYDAAAMDAIRGLLPCLPAGSQTVHAAMRLLEGGQEIIRDEKRGEAEERIRRYGALPGRDGLIRAAEARYAAAEAALKRADYRRGSGNTGRSDRIDRVVTGRWQAYPIFFAALALMFLTAFGGPGSALSGGVEAAVSALSGIADNAMRASGTPEWARSLLCEGVIAGVGGVLTFLPQILMIFLCMSVMEDSGYMARAAYIMDGPLRRIGLSGRSFIPLLMGFGCTATAVMAARGVENQRDRRMTILLTPFMSCGAKLPIYALFTSALFPERRWLTVLLLYALGLAMSAVCGALLRRTVFRNGETPFILELPDYRLPSWKGILRRLSERTKDFLVRAGTLIFAMSVAAWLLRSLSPGLRWTQDPTRSVFALLGMCIAPLFRPLGFGEWQKTTALLSGLAAKEAVVSTLQVLYASGGTDLTAQLRAHFTPASAAAYLTFVLLYSPCASALAVMRRELGSRRYFRLALGMQTAAAYVCSLAVYQIGKMFSGG